MKTLNKISFLFTAIIFSFTEISAQELTLAMEEKIRAEIESLHRQEQKAFIKGDCEKVISFYDQNATFFTRGRQITTQEERRNFCSGIPRPFTKPGNHKPDINDRFFILSETSAYFVRTIDINKGEVNASQLKKEVVTKVWAKTGEEWKIVHFHSSTDTFPSK